MKWKYFPVADDDERAKAHVLGNLATGAQGHTLSKKLLARFADAHGPMLLIALESIDLEYPYLYEYATYRGGESDPVGNEPFSWTDSPRWGLVEVLDTWLSTSPDAVVLCENWLATCEDAARGAADGSWESRILCFGGKEVYHVVTSEDRGNGAAIEATLRESQYRWATGVCSVCGDLPRDHILSEDFFDEIVDRADRLFVPALDEEGFVVWSPRTSQVRN